MFTENKSSVSKLIWHSFKRQHAICYCKWIKNNSLSTPHCTKATRSFIKISGCILQIDLHMSVYKWKKKNYCKYEISVETLYLQSFSALTNICKSLKYTPGVKLVKWVNYMLTKLLGHESLSRCVCTCQSLSLSKS